MKKITSMLLVASLLALTFPAQADPPPKTDQAMGVLLGALVLGVAAVGVYVIIKVSSNVPSDTKPVTFVLEKSMDNATWAPIATNTVILAGRRPIECFRDRITDSSAFYRARLQR
jgi:hypothetical protein